MFWVQIYSCVPGPNHVRCKYPKKVAWLICAWPQIRYDLIIIFGWHWRYWGWYTIIWLNIWSTAGTEIYIVFILWLYYASHNIILNQVQSKILTQRIGPRVPICLPRYLSIRPWATFCSFSDQSPNQRDYVSSQRQEDAPSGLPCERYFQERIRSITFVLTKTDDGDINIQFQASEYLWFISCYKK